jgi:hypothetical protein
MEKFAILVQVEAKPGIENEMLTFLKGALPLFEAELNTVKWSALQLGPSTFGVFDTFATEAGRQAHLDGKIAEALMANASALLIKDPLLRKSNY